MADDTIDSMGTELYLSLDGTTGVVFDCPTAFNGLGFTTSEMQNGCLNSTIQTTRPGRKTLSPVSVPFRLLSGSATHEWLLDQINAAAIELPYCLCLSDGVADPTVALGVFVPPGGTGTETRSGFLGTAYIASATIDINDGEVVSGTFTFNPQSMLPFYKV